MTLNLIFDSYEQRDDVRNLTRSVVDLTESHVDDNRSTSQNHKRPPHVMFTWGKFHTFPAVITSIRQNFTLFLEDGLPARATLTVSLQEVLGVSIKHLNLGQNPTSRAAGASRVREVHLGDTIDLIAAQELGSATAWRRIADANNLDDPRRLRPGQALLIPVDR